MPAVGAVPGGGGRAAGELANLVTVAGALLRAADAREETRGAHARRDFPEARAQWRRRLVHRGGWR
jgi:L-aspartate oxidase